MFLLSSSYLLASTTHKFFLFIVHRHTQGVDGRRVVLEARDAKGGGGDADMVVIDESVNR